MLEYASRVCLRVILESKRGLYVMCLLRRSSNPVSSALCATASSSWYVHMDDQSGPLMFFLSGEGHTKQKSPSSSDAVTLPVSTWHAPRWTLNVERWTAVLPLSFRCCRRSGLGWEFQITIEQSRERCDEWNAMGLRAGMHVSSIVLHHQSPSRVSFTYCLSRFRFALNFLFACKARRILACIY